MAPVTTAEGDSVAVPSGIEVTIPSGIAVSLNSTDMAVGGGLVVHGEIHVNAASAVTVAGSLDSDGLVSIVGGYNAEETVFGTARLVIAGSTQITGGNLDLRPFSELIINDGGTLENDATTSLSTSTTTRVYGTLENSGELGVDFVQSFRPLVARVLVQGGLFRNLVGGHVQLDGTISLGAAAEISVLENHGIMDLPRTSSGRGHLVNGTGLARIDNYGTINLGDTVVNTDTPNTIWNHAGAVINIQVRTTTAGDILGTLTVGPGLLVNDGLIANQGLLDNSGGGTIDQLCYGSITGNAVVGTAPNGACDTTPPIVTESVTGTLGSGDWYVSNVGIQWTITEPEGHVTSTLGCAATTLLGDTVGYTATCTVTSYGGTTTASVMVKRDGTPPTASAVASPDANGNGWNNTDVTVTYSGSDATSGIASCSAPATLGTEGTGLQVAGTCTDNAGNVSAPASVTGISIDKTAPVASVTVDPTPNAAGWNNGPVTVSWSGSDGLSGIDVCTTSVTVTGEGTTNPIGGCTDMAGNVSAPVEATVRLDLTAPTILFSGNAGHYDLMDEVTIDCVVSDSLSGIASATCPGASGPAWSFTLGSPNTLNASATDVADNEATSSTSFTVDVTAGGVHALIDLFSTDPTVQANVHRLFEGVVRADASARRARVTAFERYVLRQVGRGDITQEEADILITAVRVFAGL